MLKLSIAAPKASAAEASAPDRYSCATWAEERRTPPFCFNLSCTSLSRCWLLRSMISLMSGQASRCLKSTSLLSTPSEHLVLADTVALRVLSIRIPISPTCSGEGRLLGCGYSSHEP
jgi:hypothetical protein